MAFRAIQKGDRISEYTLLEKLGQGGFGEVWKAEHGQIPGKLVAIKVPTRPESMDYLRQEARFQHELDHPNIVRTIGLDTAHDPPYFIMEYVEGRNLRQFMMEDGILPPPYAIDIAVQVCEALAFAHARGVVHKDVKPENILVEKRRVDVSNKGKALLHYVKLTDLGLGMFPGRSSSEIVISEHARTSGVRVLSGTLFYMAPEQMIPGRPIDARADLYSVGVVLYEMLTGELPLGMDLPSELNPVVTPELDAVCKRALSIDRDVRYLSAQEMAADLQKAKEALLHKLVASGAPALEFTGTGTSRRLTPREVPLAPTSTPAPKRGRPRLEWIFALLVIGLLSGGVFAFHRLRKSSEPREKPARRDAIPAPLRLGGPLAVDSRPGEAQVWLDGARVGTTPATLPPITWERHLLRLVREFFEPRELILDPRPSAGAGRFAVIDRATMREIAVRDLSAGGSLEGIELARQKGQVQISTPRVDRASVTVDGHFYGTTPFAETLEAGIHHFVISKEGYQDLSFYERIEGGATVGKPLTLLPLGDEAPAPGRAGIHAVQIITTPPGASVFVNDEERGRSPLTLELSAGQVELRLAKRYFETRSISLAVDGPAVRTYELLRLSARVAFESDPAGATVFVDDQKVGVTPLVLETVEGGSHRARFALPGHYEQSATFEIVSRDPAERPVRASLQRIPPARLTVDAELKGLDVFVDGKLVGKIPLEGALLEGGERKLRVLGTERTMLLDPGSETRVNLTIRDLEMVRVPEGEFTYGSAAPNPGELAARTERTGAYAVDRTEVTNAQYGLFLAATAGNDHSRCHPEEDAATRERRHRPLHWTDPAYNDPKKPVVGVSWFDAFAYAAWAGKRLPTEREWEKAARGKTAWSYPWGNDWAPKERRCNSSGRDDGWELTAPAGACPGASPFGCLDMVGNASEWCADEYPGKSPSRVIRGGSFRDKEWVTTTSRWDERPGVQSPTLGFRCVVDLGTKN
jgi:formylglycine-generating enzyme required for sulfatase activity/predicted Ser/Thr protein kinase